MKICNIRRKIQPVAYNVFRTSMMLCEIPRILCRSEQLYCGTNSFGTHRVRCRRSWFGGEPSTVPHCPRWRRADTVHRCLATTDDPTSVLYVLKSSPSNRYLAFLCFNSLVSPSVIWYNQIIYCVAVHVTSLVELFVHVPLLPHSVIWYRPKDVDGLLLCRCIVCSHADRISQTKGRATWPVTVSGPCQSSLWRLTMSADKEDRQPTSAERIAWLFSQQAKP